MKFRTLAGLACASLVATALVPSPTHAAALRDASAGVATAEWLVAGLVDGAVNTPYESSGTWIDSPNYGLTAELAVNLHTLGETEAGSDLADALATVTTTLSGHVTDYTTGEAWGDAGSIYAGSTGKLAWAVDSIGSDPSNFGGVDLIDQVSATVQPSGRIQDVSGWGDYANVFGQIFATAALTDADEPDGDTALTFLLSQQCSAGFLRQDFTSSDKDAACDDASDAGSVDATAYFAAIFSDYTSDPAVASAVTDAVAWLKTQQGTDGSFTSAGAANANSTGLAAWALGESGESAAATKAAAWVRTLQTANIGGCAPFAAPDAGAVAYTAAVYKKISRQGITSALVAQTNTASVQALYGLAWAPAAKGVTFTFPKKAAKVGSTVVVKVSGAAPGTRVCGTTAKKSVAALVGANGKATAKLVLPKKSKNPKVTVAAHGAKVTTRVVTK